MNVVVVFGVDFIFLVIAAQLGRVAWLRVYFLQSVFTTCNVVHVWFLSLHMNDGNILQRVARSFCHKNGARSPRLSTPATTPTEWTARGRSELTPTTSSNWPLTPSPWRGLLRTVRLTGWRFTMVVHDWGSECDSMQCMHPSSPLFHCP